MSDQVSNAEELRKALDNAVIYDKRPAMGSVESNNARTRSLILAAARSWLALYDEATVEKVAIAIARYQGWVGGGPKEGLGLPWERLPKEYRQKFLKKAAYVVAAITEGEE